MKPLLRDMVRTGVSVAAVTGLALLPAYVLRSAGNRQTKATPTPPSDILSIVALDEGWNTIGVAINDRGEVTGTAINGQDTIRAFVVRGKKGTLLPLPKGAPLSAASDINEEGVVAGNAGGQETVRGVLWRGEQVGILTSGKRDTIAATISKEGVAAGIAVEKRESSAMAGETYHHATSEWISIFKNPYFLRSSQNNFKSWQIDAMTVLTRRMGNNGFSGMVWKRPGEGKAIGEFVPQGGNAEGSLVGVAIQKDQLVPAFFKAGKLGIMPKPQGAETAIPIGVNSSDIAVGAAAGEGQIRPAGWSKGKSGFLPVPGNRQGIAIGINNQKVAVGIIEAEDGMAHAALWKDGKVTDLNDLIDKDSGWTLVQAVDINNKGQIVGTGVKGERFATFVISLR